MPNLLRLNARLKTAADLVRPGMTAADIGTDHGYLACYLVMHSICPVVYASDINEGPLRSAKRAIDFYGLTGKVIPVLSDGVKALPLNNIDDFVVAGMGGDLILSIICDPGLYNPQKRFVLQPMTKADVLRKGLYKNGFAIIDETAVIEGRFVYTVMHAQYSGERNEPDEFFSLTGKLAGKTDSASVFYLSRVANTLEKQIKGLSRQGDSVRIKELKQLLSQVKPASIDKMR